MLVSRLYCSLADSLCQANKRLHDQLLSEIPNIFVVKRFELCMIGVSEAFV